jgi:hypothetical protein
MSRRQLAPKPRQIGKPDCSPSFSPLYRSRHLTVKKDGHLSAIEHSHAREIAYIVGVM